MITKERILQEALTLFSVKGFKAVSVRDIASAVSIKESSLYNHFKNKQDIFDSILEDYAHRENAFFAQNALSVEGKMSTDERTVAMYRTLSPEQFERVALSIFDYYFTDDINVKMRKLLTIEQYRNPEIGKLYKEVCFESALRYQTALFEAMMGAGCFTKTDPYMMAMAFFAPIFVMLYKFDTESLGEAKDLFIRHIRHFNSIYGKEV